jgi:LysR family glycine cleavage system transcriptional activator
LRRAQEKLLHAKTSSGLVLSCLSSIATRWIGPQLFDWQAAHPEAKIRLTGAETEPRLTGEFVDFRISYGSAVRGFEHSAELFHDWAVPVCAPSLLHAHAVADPSDLLRLPLINVEWDSSFGNAPSWKEWAASIGAASRHRTPSELAYSLSSAAIDAAVHGRGVVLAQVSLIGDDLASGRLVAPFDHRVPLDQPYFLAWDRAVLQKPHGPQFRSWLLTMGKRQAKASIGPLPVR